MNRCSLYSFFEANREEDTLEYLGRFLDNAKVGVTKEKYIKMCEQLGDPIQEDRIPPEMDDFPSYVETAISIFNSLPDMYSGGMEPIYSGKDIGAINTLYDIFSVENDDKLRVFRVVHYLDSRARKQAINEAKRKANKDKPARGKK